MARFCGNCGAACNEQQAYCYNCSRPLQPSSQSYQTLYEPPMKWYNFIIYFQLFAAAVSCVITGIMYISGSNYGEAKDLVYEIFAKLKFLDFFYGLVCLGLAGFALYVRSRLRWMEENGPKMYYTFLALNGALPLVYLIAFSMVLGDLGSYAKRILESSGVMSMLTTSMVSSLISTAIMLVCNVIYFKKREHLFGDVPAYNTPSYSAPAAPAYNPAHGISPNSQPRAVASVPASGWICDCGRVHTAYVSSCICGMSKSDIQKRKAEAVKAAKAAEEEKAAEAAKVAAAAKAATEAKAAELAQKEALQEQIQVLKSYKELLDAGILTQEEFDAKKKEILKL